jgi:alpha-mannosidase
MARVDAPGVIIETLKWAEDEDALIVRAYEADGGAITARLQLGVPITSIAEVDLLERNPRPLRPHADGSVDVQFRAREVKTIRVRVETAKSLGRE